MSCAIYKYRNTKLLFVYNQLTKAQLLDTFQIIGKQLRALINAQHITPEDLSKRLSNEQFWQLRKLNPIIPLKGAILCYLVQNLTVTIGFKFTHLAINLWNKSKGDEQERLIV
ncbi:hypothetical protein FGO68_gene5857 [Halteria grandinella]|uniref:Uncharacterized protein n=1 Tax=Halteria grandinella TaxID=5974 RepID=A0A8J8P413_HALGN|nr:hypothetical protein FGO68_gene5857 [Halteria grandinella]